MPYRLVPSQKALYVCILRLAISTHVYFATNVAYFPFNSWLSFQRLCRLYGDIIFILSKIKKLNFTAGAKKPTCITVPNLIKIGQTVEEIWQFNGFQNCGHPPSWICWAPTGTTHDDHLVVFIVTPNLVKIDAVVSIT